MRKIAIISAVLFSFFFTECKKNTVSTSNTDTTAPELVVTAQNTLNVESVKGLPNQDLKKIAYGLLKPIERYLLWVDNIKVASANFTPQQKLLTVELIAFLTPQLFDKPDLGGAASFREQWLTKAKKIFTADQIKDLAYNIYSSTDQKAQLSVNQEGPKLNKCNCNTGSNYSCGGATFCPNDFDHADCRDPSSWGCGFVGLWACDNLCVTPGESV
ncbi:MAG: bacteriocin fulvocin C-related protein [Bacteroidota bacterium]